MGFIVRRFIVTTGDSDFPSGTGDELIKLRSETCLTKYAQILIDCNVGWQLDTARNQSITTYTYLNTTTTGKVYPALFFINSISGCKLLMCYYGYNNSIRPVDFSGNDFLKYAGGNRMHGGIILSVIPSGSSSEFGEPNSSEFIPSDATRLIGTYYKITSPSSANYAAAYRPKDGYSYVYYVGATPYTIFTYCNYIYSGKSDGAIGIPIYACGRILDVLVHEEDNSLISKYGVVLFRDQSGDFEGWADVIRTSYTSSWLSNSTPYYAIGHNASSPSVGVELYNLPTSGAFLKQDGTWVNGRTTSTSNCYCVIIFASEPNILFSNIFSKNGEKRWCAIGMASLSFDVLDDYGVIPGDGFKGYLDTSLFRAIGNGNRGETFDDKKFICLENNCGLLIGWDSLNENYITN